MIGVLMKAEYQASIRFDPVDAVVFVIDTGRVPEANLQSCPLRIIGITQKCCQIDIRDDVPRPSSRRAITHVLTTSLIRQSVVNVSEEGPLCISVTTSEKIIV
ncbi:hypothetical protein [Halalkalicoccus subterraneus]|uniref:hypothetical protein n=1 Tax=Halalkalicoccus subterraneus TaxID=2675002 RepID=UPI001B8605B2|nr:hypothetical protein [Halalkalicoccus subterraneus]